MPFCFVMQPFDGGAYDSRYEDVYAPAIEEAGLEAYRVDRDPSVSIPIQEIESGIKDARICLADISEDNPNVWFELGYAFASGKEVIMVCSELRSTKFPFDVQHRSIIRYRTGAPRYFDELKKSIVARITAALQKPEALKATTTAALLNNVSGLDHAEIMALAAIGENLPDGEQFAPAYSVYQDIKAAGFTQLAAKLAMRGLVQRDFIIGQHYSSQWSQDEEMYGYELTDKGWEWIIQNRDRFALKREKPSKNEPFSDDIPF